MTSCELVSAAIDLYRDVPRQDLPGWLRNPTNELEADMAFAVLGLEPVCHDGQVVAWRGIGVAQ